MRAPWFWKNETRLQKAVGFLLRPVAGLYQLGAAAREAFSDPVGSKKTVICIGGVSLGGTGKTPFSIYIFQLLSAHKRRACFLTRGYKGRMKETVWVDPTSNNASDVGDEAMLLAAQGPTLKATNKRDGLAGCDEHDAEIIIMDDGLQNPTVKKDIEIVLIDASRFEVDRFSFPAGPLREPYDKAIARADIVVALGTEAKPDWADFHGWISSAGLPSPRKVVVFSAIANPDRFVRMLTRAGFEIVDHIEYSDHHFFSNEELELAVKRAHKLDAQLITTAKDATRIPSHYLDNFLVADVTVELSDEGRFADELISRIDAAIREKAAEKA